MKVKCECGREIEVNPAKLLRSIPSEARKKASRENGKKHIKKQKDTNEIKN